jgi:hypothetical protein
LLKDLTSSQVAEWLAYDKLDPVGKWRDELSIASVCSLITNTVRQLHTKKGHKVEFTSPNDFMIDWGKMEEQKPEPKQQSQEEMAQVLRNLALISGTRDKIEKK